MNAVLREDEFGSRAIPAADLRFLRIMLGLQVALGLLWGVSMLFFARQIVLGAPDGPHIEKIAMEGAAHMMLVFGAVPVWRAPQRTRDVLLIPADRPRSAAAGAPGIAKIATRTPVQKAIKVV